MKILRRQKFRKGSAILFSFVKILLQTSLFGFGGPSYILVLPHAAKYVPKIVVICELSNFAN